jgi:glucose/arabinose dehydrogenase
MHLKLQLSIAVCCFSFFIQAQAPQLELEYFAYGLERPVDIAHPKGDSMLYVVQQTGKIRIVNPTTSSIFAGHFLDLTGIAVMPDGNEQGLLGLAFHPEYANNGWFYVNYINIERKTVIQRFTRSSTEYFKADSTSGVVVMEIDQPFANHNGGCLRFGKDGMLYIGMGDGGFSDLPADPNGNAQNPASLLGKMLRINVDALPYTIPITNPYINNPAFRPEIWALGLRNPWRFNFDSKNGDLWLGDVGMQKFEEVNLIRFGDNTGKNFGWKCLEGTVSYNNTICSDTIVLTPPLFEYGNVGGFCGASVVGGVVYHGEKYPGMKDMYVFNDFCTGDFYGIRIDAFGQINQNFLGHFPLTYDYAAFGEGEDGEIYMVGYISQGLYRIKDKCLITPAPTPLIVSNGGAPPLTCTLPSDTSLMYQWYLNGIPIANANADTVGYFGDGAYSLIITNEQGCQSISDNIAIAVVNTNEIMQKTSDFKIFPNPSNAIVNLQLSENWKGQNTLTLYDLVGKMIETFDFQHVAKETRIINFRNIQQKGVYVLEIRNKNGQVGRQKLILQ